MNVLPRYPGRLGFVFCVILMLYACAYPKPEHKTNLSLTPDWILQGRIALTTPSERTQGHLYWQQHNEDYVIRLSGPIGQGQFILSQTGSKALLRDVKHNVYEGRKGEQLLYEQTGWYIPLSGLRYWLKGQFSPHLPRQTQYDQYGRLSSLTQSDWEINYLRYKTFAGNALPTELLIKNKRGSTTSTSSASWEIRLAIHEWTLP